MSNMLEQAIIDAAALRETAIKSAESALIDKYKNEFEDTLQRLLEEEDPAAAQAEPQEMSPETAAANAEDPTGPTLEDAPIEDPMAIGGTEEKKSKVFDKIKSAFFNLDGDDDELITINFDGLKANPSEKDVSSLGAAAESGLTAPSPLDAQPMFESLDEELEIELDERYNAGHNFDSMIDEDEELEEELELDEEELQETNDNDPTIVANLKSRGAKSIAQGNADNALAAKMEADAERRAAEEKRKAPTPQISSKIPKALEENEESIELTEEELEEIEESLRVDMQNESEGYMGSHKKKEREFKNVAYAAARDTKNSKYRLEKGKAVQDLEESVKFHKNKSSQLNKINEDLLGLVKTLKEQIEQMNVSNAKLLYTNKALSNDSLNERQKNYIVENITKASSVSEAKTIYETLQSTVQSVKESSTPKSLSEALNRTKTPFLVRKEPANINESFSDRMKLLAGIKTL